MNAKQKDLIKDALLQMLAKQVRHYLKGHYMRLDTHSLSLSAVLRDGYAAKNIVNIYLLHDPDIMPNAVMELAIAKQKDLILRGDGISFYANS